MAKKLDSITPVKKTRPSKESAKSSSQSLEKTGNNNVAQPQPEEAVPEYSSLFPEPRTSISSPPQWVWWLTLIVVIVVILSLGYSTVQSNLNSWLTPPTNNSISSTPTATATPEAAPTPSPSPSATPIPEDTPTAQPSVTATPSPTSTPLAANSVSLRVLNGTTTEGAAAYASSRLENAGFIVRAMGNARNQTYQTTTIYFQPGQAEAASLVQQALATEYQTIVQESSLADPDHVLVVIGHN